MQKFIFHFFTFFCDLIANLKIISILKQFLSHMVHKFHWMSIEIKILKVLLRRIDIFKILSGRSFIYITDLFLTSRTMVILSFLFACKATKCSVSVPWLGLSVSIEVTLRGCTFFRGNLFV
jgi:hypothetical protein